jgi:hypothetical protein
MYRTPAEKDAQGTPRELTYDATDEGAGRGDGMLVLFRHVSLPLLACAAAGWLGGQIVGLAALGGAGAYSVWAWRNRKKRGGAVLAVRDAELVVNVRGRRALQESFALRELADVTLDVKTIQRVSEGSSAIPAMRFIDSKVGAKVDTARIVLVGPGGREVPLTDEFLPHMHATEWLGKIRSFLRKNGWVPDDERDGEVEPEAESAP